MQTKTFFERKTLRFKHFSHKNYALFSCLGCVVLVGTLSVPTLTYAKADGISVNDEAAMDTLNRKELKLDEVVITGSRAPLTQLESAKLVSVISRDDIQRAAAESVNDILKLATGVDVRQRGGFGVQTDISVRGGNYDQITILLNGVNISSPQTGHLSADLPVSPDDIERIEVLEGPSARVYGTSAFNGVINIVTKKGEGLRMKDESLGEGLRKKDEGLVGGAVNLYAGQYGYAGGNGSVSYSPNASFHNRLSGGYTRSDGATSNSNFSSTRFFYQGGYQSGDAKVDVQMGYSYKPFGANTFYGTASSDQWESNERMMFAINAEMQTGKLHLAPQAYWNRWNDHYQWHKGVTPSGENYHQTDVYGIGLNSWFESSLGKTSLGVEMRNEGIWSTNLGNDLDEAKYRTVAGIDGNSDRQYKKRDQRTNVSAFLEHNILLHDWTYSFGLLANYNTALDAQWRLYPGVDVAYRPTEHLKLLASWSMALRMPTFTELYYNTQGVNIIGNKDLKPEKTSDVQLGARYSVNGFVCELQGFYSHKTDMIDWVTTQDFPQTTSNLITTYYFHSVNFKADNIGCDVTLKFMPRELWGETCPLRKVGLQYSYINENAKYDVEILQSKYAMEYLRHKVVISADGVILRKGILSPSGELVGGFNWRWQDRVGANNPSYALLDARLSWDESHWSIYVSGNNILDKKYYDYIAIPQPGAWYVAGVKVQF